MDLNIEIEEFKAAWLSAGGHFKFYEYNSKFSKFEPTGFNGMLTQQELINTLVVVNTSWGMWQAAKAHEAEKLKGCVVVPKSQTEDWYLDPNEHIWYEQDGIDYALSYIDIGEVTAIEHKEYLITESDTLYAAIVWDDSNDQVGFWEFFKTEEEAEKAAAHCKAMVEAARGGNE